MHRSCTAFLGDTPQHKVHIDADIGKQHTLTISLLLAVFLVGAAAFCCRRRLSKITPQQTAAASMAASPSPRMSPAHHGKCFLLL